MTATGAIRLVMALRGGGITDTALLSAVERTPREAFLPASMADRAWDDAAQEPGDRPRLERPFVVVSMIAALAPWGRHRVLVARAGAGYAAALLSHLCRWVYATDPDRGVRQRAAERFRELGIENVILQGGAPRDGWPQQAPFDRILIESPMDDVPKELLDQLRPGGALVAAPGRDVRTVTRFTRGADGFAREDLMRVPGATPRGQGD